MVERGSSPFARRASAGGRLRESVTDPLPPRSEHPRGHCTSWPDEGLLQPSGGIEMVARPDHPDGGGRGVPSPSRRSRRTASSSRPVGERRAGRLRHGAAGEGRRELVVPGRPPRWRSSSARLGPPAVAAAGAPSSRSQRSSTASAASRTDNPGDQPGHLGERHRLGAAFGEEAAERVVEPARGRRRARRLGAGRAGGGGRSQRTMPNSTARHR